MGAGEHGAEGSCLHRRPEAEGSGQRPTGPFALCVCVLKALQQCDFSDSCGFFA